MSTVIFSFPIDRYLVVFLQVIYRMVSTCSISVVISEIIHKKRGFCWERSVAPNARVGTQGIIAMGFDNFTIRSKSIQATCFKPYVSLQISTQNNHICLPNPRCYTDHDVLGKPLQQNLCVFKRRHWVVQKIIFDNCAKNWAPGVEIVLLNISLESRSDAEGVLGYPGQIGLSHPMVRRTQ